MNNIRFPQIDSAVFRGLVTMYQAFLTFVLGFIVTILQVPGVTDAAKDYVWNQAPQTLFAMGIPLIIGTGIVSFIMNYLFRRNVPTY